MKSKNVLRLGLLFTVCFMLITLVSVGCGSDDEDKKEEGHKDKISIAEDAESGKVTTPEGTLEWESKEGEPTEDDLGVPIYPNAVYEEGSGGTGMFATEDGTLAGGGGKWETKDSFEEVVNWYKQKTAQEPMVDTADPEERTAVWVIMEEDYVKTITVYKERGIVSISIGVVSGGGFQLPQ